MKGTGSLDLDVFRRSVCEVVRRHESLRTGIPVAANGEPQQVIRPEPNDEVPSPVDLRSLPASKREQEVYDLVLGEINTPFNLGTAPLWRVRLFRLQEREYVLLVVMHHIISDGWSMGVMLSEVSIFYKAFLAGKSSPLPELPIQYADFSEWERELLAGHGLQEQLSYWTKMLSGISALQLPYDRPKKTATPGKGGSHFLRVEADLAEKLLQLGQQQNATLHMTLLAAYQTLLYRYTGQQDIAVGSNIAQTQSSRCGGIDRILLHQRDSEDKAFRELELLPALGPCPRDSPRRVRSSRYSA